MPYIGLISDTHCYFDAPVAKFLEPVDEIWHAGDFGDLETARKIAAVKPLRGVYGNCDGTDIRLVYPYTQFFECGGLASSPGRVGHPWAQPLPPMRKNAFCLGNDPLFELSCPEGAVPKL